MLKILNGIYNLVETQNHILPFYHVVSDKDLPHIKNLYSYRNKKSFEQDLDFLLKKYTPVDILTFYQNIVNKAGNHKCFLLSFDDGLTEIYHEVLPILLRKGVPAIVFVNSAFVDNKSLFYRFKASLIVQKLKNKTYSNPILKQLSNILGVSSVDINAICSAVLNVSYLKKSLLDDCAILIGIDFNEFLQTQKPYMSLDELRVIDDKGVAIGAHSVDHPEYWLIPEEEQVWQTYESVRFVTDCFPEALKSFSFPFTDFNVSKNVFEQIREFVDVSFGCAGLKNDTITGHYQRIPVENYANVKEALRDQFLKSLARRLLLKNTIGRQ